MIQHARRSIQGNNKADNQESCGNNAKRVLIAEADSEDGRCEFPRCSIERIREPVRNQGPDRPFPVATSDRVEI